MDENLIKPFIDSTLNVLNTMAFTNPAVGKPLNKLNSKTWGEVTGVIGMAGENISGTLIISFDEHSILEIVNKLLSEKFTEITDEVIDAAGEITNMICGGTKTALQNNNFKFEMATPILIKGKGVAIKQLSKEKSTIIPFKTNTGEFIIEASLEPRQ